MISFGLIVCDCLWSFVIVCDPCNCSRLFLIICDWLLGWSFVIHLVDRLWSFVIVCDRLWSFELIVCDRLWLFVIVFDHLWLVVIVNWLHFLDCLKWQIFIVLAFSLPNSILNIVLLFCCCCWICAWYFQSLIKWSLWFFFHSLCPLCPLT